MENFVLENYDYLKFASKFFCQSEKLAGEKINHLDLDLADHCNRNCARCGHFSPIAKKNFPNKEELTKDLTRLAELTKDKPILTINIMGGEPLLNPDIVYYFDLLHSLFPNTLLVLITNGLLIPSMNNDFFEALKRNNVVTVISKYSNVTNAYDKMVEIYKSHNCNTPTFNENKGFGCMLFISLNITHKNTLTKEQIWNSCPLKNGSIMLRNGKLYSCKISCLMFTLNDYFNENFEIDPNDGVDIYNNSLENIIAKLQMSKTACKYCNTKAFQTLYLPELSKREKSEWISD